MKITAVRLLILLLVINIITFAQENNLINKARKIFEKNENIQISFVYKNSNKDGQILYSKNFGEKLIFGDYEIVVKKDTVFNFNKKINRFVISIKDEEYSNFSLKNILFDLPERCLIKQNGNKLTLVPKNPDAENFSTVKITFGKNKLPKHILFYGTDGNKSVFEIINYSFQKHFTKNDFTIKTNGKTKVIDFRE